MTLRNGNILACLPVRRKNNEISYRLIYSVYNRDLYDVNLMVTILRKTYEQM